MGHNRQLYTNWILRPEGHHHANTVTADTGSRVTGL